MANIHAYAVMIHGHWVETYEAAKEQGLRAYLHTHYKGRLIIKNEKTVHVKEGKHSLRYVSSNHHLAVLHPNGGLHMMNIHRITSRTNKQKSIVK